MRTLVLLATPKSQVRNTWFAPKVANRFQIMRKYYITFKVTKLEKKLLQQAAKEAGLDLSKYLRQVGLNKKIRARLSNEELDLFKELVKIHNGWKSIGNLFKNKDPRLKNEVHKLADELRLNLKKFQ